jgi:crossover junction endodeoxyribonuclease RuvC
LFEQLTDLIHLHRPDSSAVEKLYFQKNVKTAISVGQARGVAMLTLAQAGLSIAEYTPNEVKQSVCGYGSAGKSQVQRMVQALLRLEDLPHPDDAADALAVAICHISHHTYNQRIENAQ